MKATNKGTTLKHLKQVHTLNQKTKLLFAGVLSSVALFLIQASPTHAATLTVAAGNDENTDNSSCSLSEAIENINGGANTNTDCVPTGSYGTDDTITLPTGTITLTADLDTITQPVTIEGQGMGKSIVDGDNGQYKAFNATIDPTGTISFNNLTVTGFLMDNSGGIFVQTGNVVIDKVEIDGTGAMGGTGLGSTDAGILINNKSTTPSTVHISNTYIHSFTSDANVMNGILVSTGDDGSSDSEDINVLIEKSTVEDLAVSSSGGYVFGITVGTGVSLAANGVGSMTATVRNNTVTNLESSTGAAVGINAEMISSVGASSPLQATITNNTVSNLSGVGASLGFSSSSLLELSASFIDDLTNNVSVNAENNVLINTGGNCSTVEFSSLFNPSTTSTTNFSLTSGGGNLADDNSCSSYFTEPTDQNNVANLSSTLSALADNGGYVPTMALKQGSPAIDSGVTVAGLTTDARGEARPQGSAYDSGAYEYVPQNTETLANTGQSVIAGLALCIFLMVVSGLLFTKQRV